MIHFFIRNISICFLFGFSPILLCGQSTELATADSLFNSQKYTEAYETYEEIFNNNLASPAMLTRMAFIQEGLGNYSDALYFLNLYYIKTSDRAALAKMREIAEEHNLSGYEYSDLKFFSNFTHKHRHLITLCLVAFSLFLVAYSLRKVKKDERPLISVVLQALTLLIILFINNELFIKDSGIIKQDQSILMSGPSAGAEPLEVVGQGNKVTILDTDDLWSKIEWQGTEAYIRNKNIRKL